MKDITKYYEPTIECASRDLLASIQSHYLVKLVQNNYDNVPVMRKRMQDIMKEGRAETIPEALKLLKEDLKALNSNVVVEKEEYDEIVTIKPMFLVMGYK